MLLWLTLFGPHPVPKISQQSGDNDLSHRILMQNWEQSFVVIGFRTYPGPSSDGHVAWRARSCVTNPAETLQGVLASMLGEMASQQARSSVWEEREAYPSLQTSHGPRRSGTRASYEMLPRSTRETFPKKCCWSRAALVLRREKCLLLGTRWVKHEWCPRGMWATPHVPSQTPTSMLLAGLGQRNGTVPRSWLFSPCAILYGNKWCEERLPIGTRHIMVAKLAVAFFPKSTKEVSEDDTPHDERDESFWVR